MLRYTITYALLLPFDWVFAMGIIKPWHWPWEEKANFETF